MEMSLIFEWGNWVEGRIVAAVDGNTCVKGICWRMRLDVRNRVSGETLLVTFPDMRSVE